MREQRAGRAHRSGRLPALAAALLVLAASACGTEPDVTIDVLMVDNPQMVELQQLTASEFTAKTGIKVHFTLLSENELRDEVDREFTAQAGKYDVASVSNFEAPIFADRHLLKPLTPYARDDDQFDEDDLIEPIADSLRGSDGQLYAAPFYGESSMLMYRTDVLGNLGIRLPATPTWQQVADAASAVEHSGTGMHGICLRGLPGWGEMIAPLTTVVNTFGGTWFDDKWGVGTGSPEFRQAVKFYLDTLRKSGEDDPTHTGYQECLKAVEDGKVAMWYDATAGAAQLEAASSAVRSKMGYLSAPVVKTSTSGWLYTWAWGLEQSSDHPDEAWKFMSWASSRDYERLAGRMVGWSKAPAGKRYSTYDDAEYLSEAGAFAMPTYLSITSVDPRKAGVQPRPATGIQFVGVPEFRELGTKASETLASVIDGSTSLDDALAEIHAMAEKVAVQYRK
ncbi:extracellular solute-binding protein [Amycolatopsis jiangsuensis]|uniref:Sorbitol/mannitol transport system substrate-binding protein n=1 Tax=Amycolatopsis jiangsuensis TaxID=1181879 RepID=A0A840IN16_9PSEU|nr:extracellular solute-binding protein [Amycolatopsis jiangsuensis]MBB4683283.1 sorbitol/mannitol transport system substrate-binding protein [Amycolatopsis jiangsuensis]